MARSSYIYVVVNADPRDFPIIAAFTVKHELVTWWKRHPDNNPDLDWHVLRCRDGGIGGRPMHGGAPTIHEFVESN